MRKVPVYFLIFALFCASFAQLASASQASATVVGSITGLAYQSRGETDITLRWPAVTGASLISFEQRLSGSPFWTKSTTKDWLWPNATNVTLTGLTSNTLYEFRMVVLGGANAGISNTVSVKTDINLLLKTLNAGNYFDWSPGAGTVYQDLSYGNKASNKYDLYIPTNASQTDDLGVVLHLHGGSWTAGDKADDVSYPKRYAQNGFIAASMNYSYAGDSDGTTAETMLDEIGACIAAIKQELTNRGFHVSRIAISGYSAGAHLASLFAYSRGNDAALPVELVINNVGPTDFHLDTWENMPNFIVIPFVGYLLGHSVTVEQLLSGELEEEINSISPLHFVNSNSPPTVMSYGGYDQLVPQSHNQKLLAALQQAGVDHKYIFLPYSDHVIGNDPDKTTERFNAAITYLNTYLAPIPLAQP